MKSIAVLQICLDVAINEVRQADAAHSVAVRSMQLAKKEIVTRLKNQERLINRLRGKN